MHSPLPTVYFGKAPVVQKQNSTYYVPHPLHPYWGKQYTTKPFLVPIDKMGEYSSQVYWLTEQDMVTS